MTTEEFTRPSQLLWRAEGPRTMAELSQFWAKFPLLALGPRGDGHAVLTLPGFVAGDSSLGPLRTLLRTLGYRPAPWQLGRNVGPSQRILDGMSQRLVALHRESGGPVSIVGQSLGGIYARDLARRFPEMVRGVITLGSPLRLTARPHHPHQTNTGRLYEATRCWHAESFVNRPPESEQPPLPVPATAIYSRTDGVVPWRSCLELDGPLSESVEVSGSHCGLGCHVRAVEVVLDRLAQTPGEWAPFHWRPARAA